MPEYDNTNRGAIWKNERKTEETHPDLTGKLDVEGVMYFFDAWKRKTGENPKTPALRFKITRMDKQPDGQKIKESVTESPPDFDDEIPF